MLSKLKGCFWKHHSMQRDLKRFDYRFPRQPNPRFFVGKVGPSKPGNIWLKRTVGGSSFIGQDISLTIAMQIFGGYPAEINISLLKVRFHPADSLPRVKGLEDSLLEISVSPFGVSAPGLKSLDNPDNAFTVANDFVRSAFFQRVSNNMQLRTIN
eukprot:5109707-Amphidinium_carterae.1